MPIRLPHDSVPSARCRVPVRRHGFDRLRRTRRPRLRHLRASLQLRPANRAAGTAKVLRRSPSSLDIRAVPAPAHRLVPAHRRIRPHRRCYRRSSRPRTRSAIGHEIPVTYVPFRNAHFLSAAVSWAEVLGAHHVFIGAVEQDSSGYPDCRPAYYHAFQQLIRTGTRDGDIEVVTPLIHMRKNQIVGLGLELSVPFHLTWSCYSGEEKACGVCDSCVLRLKAFREAGAEDPLPYATLALSQ